MAEPNQPLSSEPLIEAWVDHSGGQNTYGFPFLAENEFYRVINADVSRQGRRTQRSWAQSLGGSFTARPQGFGPAVNSRLIAISGRHPAYYSFAASAWSSPSSLVSCYTGGLWHTLVGQQINGSGSVVDVNIFHAFHHLSADSVIAHRIITAPDGLASATQITIGAKALCWWQGRLWAGNITNGPASWGHNTLCWSDISDGCLFPSTQSINVSPHEDDYIQAILPARGSGSSLYIFKNASIWRLDVVWGSGVYIPTTENSLDTTESRLLLVSENTGCIAPRTVCHVGSGYDSDVFFLSTTGVQSLKRVEQDVAGGASEPISRPIQDIIDRITWEKAAKACAMVYDHKYFLAVPLDGASDNTVVLIFDLLAKHWIGEYDWHVRDFATIFHPGEGAGSYVKRIIPCFFSLTANSSGLYDAVRGDEKQAAIPPRTEVNGTYMVYEEFTRPFHFGDFFKTKRWNWMECVCAPPATNATITVYTKVDEGNWGLLGHQALSPSGTYLMLPASAPWTATATPLLPVRFDLTEVPHGHFIRFRVISQNPSPVTIYTTRVSAWPQADIWTE